MVAQVLNFAFRIFTPVSLSGPIFGKELRVVSRRKRHYLLRVAYLGLLSLFVIIAWLNTVDYSANSATSIYRMADAGKWIVGTVCWCKGRSKSVALGGRKVQRLSSIYV